MIFTHCSGQVWPKRSDTIHCLKATFTLRMQLTSNIYRVIKCISLGFYSICFVFGGWLLLFGMIMIIMMMTKMMICSSTSGTSIQVPADLPLCGGDVAVYVFDINQPSLPTPFYSGLVSLSVLIALSTVFLYMTSPDNSPLSHSVLPVLYLPHRPFQRYISNGSILQPSWLTGLRAPTN